MRPSALGSIPSRFSPSLPVASVLAGALFCAAPFSTVGGQSVLIPTEAKLLPSLGTAGDGFGTRVAVSGDLVVVGAPNDDELGTDAGKAYVFRRASGWTWSLEEVLTADDPSAGASLGCAVAVEDGWVAVGAPFDDEAGFNAGAVYVFRRLGNSWVQHAKLPLPALARGSEHFGSAVAIDASVAIDNPSKEPFVTLVGGAPNFNILGQVTPDNKGAAFVYQLSLDESAWDFRFEIDAGDLVPPDTSASVDFARSVDVSRDVMVFGDPEYASPGVQSGAAYEAGRFNITNNWALGTRWVGSEVSPGDRYGGAVAVDVDPTSNVPTLVFGARRDDDFGSDTGSAYVFKQGVEQKLLASDAGSGHTFGRALDLDANLLAVGADGRIMDTGAVYLFRRDHVLADYGELGRIEASDGAVGDRFGAAIAVDRATLVVGAPDEDERGNGAGAAYVYDLSPFDISIFGDGFESGDVAAWSSVVP